METSPIGRILGEKKYITRGKFGFDLPISACGPAVHNEVSERATFWFNKHVPNRVGLKDRSEYIRIINDNKKSLQAGTVFPDWGYECWGNDYAAEAAHWTPFIKAGIEHLRENYQKPYTKSAEEFIAFLFGVAAHQVSDELWHGVRMDEGFLKLLRETEYLDDFNGAHDLLDVGGDFYMRIIDDLSYLEVYKRMNIDITRISLETCMTRQYYAMQAIKKLGNRLFIKYAKKSSILVEKFDSYFRGGLYSMSVQTYKCWNYLADWITTGERPECNCLVNDKVGRKNRKTTVIKKILSEGKEQFGRVEDFVQVSRTIKDTIISQKEFKFKVTKNISEIMSSTECSDISSLYNKQTLLYTMQKYSGFASSVAIGDFDGSGNFKTVLAAPFHCPEESNTCGTVFLTQNNSTGENDIENISSKINLQSNTTILQFPKFGASVLVADINNDGIDDLIIGAPWINGVLSENMGSVYVYFGRKGKGLAEIPDTIIDSHNNELSSYGSVKMGEQLFSTSIGGINTLVIGAPQSKLGNARQAGLVAVYKYISNDIDSTGGKFKLISVLTSKNPKKYENFGSSIASISNSKDDILIVGAPGFIQNSKKEFGNNRQIPIMENESRSKVYGFVWKNNKFVEETSIVDFGHQGLFGKLVVSCKDSSQAVFIAAPARHKEVDDGIDYWQSGSVAKSNWETGFGNITVKVSEMWDGSHVLGHFGESIACDSEGLWIGEPLSYNNDGRIYFIGKNDRKCYYNGNSKGSRFGSLIQVLKKENSGSMLVVGQSHDSKFSRLAGSISLFYQ
ncbi:hypothetical protein BB558_007044 [Smittium angustum]|uniref:Phosphatidylinositol-glycan-specific phospholipase D n=1 Tax=Smittium angustum TaxID=133377 RepID=A0A2U1IW49_SMIAN|nr:hypothetical protein BB558_007044 [Smittium angustum]